MDLKKIFGSRIIIPLILLVLLEAIIFIGLKFGFFDKWFGRVNLKNASYLNVFGRQNPLKNDDLSSSGAKWANITVTWEEVEPGLEKYDFSKLDQKLNEFRRTPILLTVLANHSRLTICSDENNNASCPPRKTEEYESFLQNLIKHLQDRVMFIQIEKDLSKNNWQGTDDQYLELLKTASQVKNSHFIVSANINLADYKSQEKIIDAKKYYDILAIGAADETSKIQEQINNLTAALKDKSVSQPVWAFLDFSPAIKADEQQFTNQAIKKPLILLTSGVEKIFYPADILSAVRQFNVALAEMIAIDRIDFGEGIWVYQVTSKAYIKPVFLAWADGKAEIDFQIDPAYYDAADFSGKKLKISGKKITIDSNGLLMLPI